ncbi:MAG: type II toxin-antitoxin system VapC family toxin [Dehalococcoidia bacterium]
MRLLLDTEVWLWAHFARRQLLPGALASLEDPDNERFVSVATWWEISIKHALGKLPLPEPLDAYLPSRLGATAASLLEIRPAHVIGVAALPHLHRDPFDRLLISQAHSEGLTLVTADADIARYEVDVLWANRRLRQP